VRSAALQQGHLGSSFEKNIPQYEHLLCPSLYLILFGTDSAASIRHMPLHERAINNTSHYMENLSINERKKKNALL
jgi:hypothetical protein